jgi:hypothetical protein
MRNSVEVNGQIYTKEDLDGLSDLLDSLYEELGDEEIPHLQLVERISDGIPGIVLTQGVAFGLIEGWDPEDAEEFNLAVTYVNDDQESPNYGQAAALFYRDDEELLRKWKVCE